MSAKKKILAAASYVMVAAMAVGGTVAYLTYQTDAIPNVMTAGDVSIEQLEYERVVDEDGEWVSTGKADQYGYTPDAMQEFTQGKLVLPAVYRDKSVKWDDRNGSQAATGAESHQQSWAEVGAPGSNQLFDDSVENVIDKFVFVKNTGNAPAYYRTIIAIECPDGFDPELIHVNTNGNTRFTWSELTETVTIDETKYAIMTATYNETLAAGEISRPSLLQVFLDPAATSEDLDKLGNSWEILTLSQAVQVTGTDAGAALNEAFKEVSGDTVPGWFAGTLTVAAPASGAVRPAGYNPVDNGTNAVDGMTIIDNSDDATNLRALYTGDNKKLSGDFTVSNSYLDGTYAMNVIGDDTGVLTVTDTTLKGWVSYDGFTSASFTNCTFAMNSSPEYYKTIRPYSAITLKNCDFEAGYEFWLDKLDGAKVTFENCTIGGVLIDSADDLNIVYGDAGSVEIKNK